MENALLRPRCQDEELGAHCEAGILPCEADILPCEASPHFILPYGRGDRGRVANTCPGGWVTVPTRLHVVRAQWPAQPQGLPRSPLRTQPSTGQWPQCQAPKLYSPHPENGAGGPAPRAGRYLHPFSLQYSLLIQGTDLYRLAREELQLIFL